MLAHPFRTLTVLGLIGLTYVTFFVLPPGPRESSDFDPVRVARLHLEMWKDDTIGNTVGTFTSCAKLLREQYKYSWFRAGQAAYHLASATSQYRSSRNHYDLLLPDLEAANAIERDWLNATFDPGKVAKAELAWWISIRRSELNTLTNISGLIGDELAQRYGGDRGDYAAAATLLARAVDLRQQGGQDPDWSEIGTLLEQHYRELRAVLQARRGGRRV